MTGCGASAQRLQTLPDTIAADQVDGSLTVVVFVDFECPYSQSQHPDLLEALAPHRARVHLLRRYTPVREQGVAAAQAAVCADSLGRGDELAAALFESDTLDEGTIRQLGSSVGLDSDELSRCMADPATRHRLEIDAGAATNASLVAVPTTFVGMDRFDGRASTGAIADSVLSQL